LQFVILILITFKCNSFYCTYLFILLAACGLLFLGILAAAMRNATQKITHIFVDFIVL